MTFANSPALTVPALTPLDAITAPTPPVPVIPVRWASTAEMAAAVGVHRKTLAVWARKKIIPPASVVSRQIRRWPYFEVLAALAARAGQDATGAA